MDLAQSRTIRKIIIPLALATLLRRNRLANLTTVESAINAIIEIIILTTIFLVAFKYIPQILNKLTQN